MRYFTLIIFIALTVGMATLYTLPMWRQAQAEAADIAINQERLQTADSLTKSRADLIGKYNSIPKADLDNLKSLLPDNVHNIRLIIQVDSLAAKNGLSTLQNVSYKTNDDDAAPDVKNPKTAQAQLPYQPFTISFETVGTYKNFLSFIADLEHNLRLVDIQDVTFVPVVDAPNSAPSGLITYKVKVNTYWLKQ